MIPFLKSWCTFKNQFILWWKRLSLCCLTLCDHNNNSVQFTFCDSGLIPNTFLKISYGIFFSDLFSITVFYDLFCVLLISLLLLSSEFINLLFSFFKGTLNTISLRLISFFDYGSLLKLHMFYGIIWLLISFVFIKYSLSALFMLGTS